MRRKSTKDRQTASRTVILAAINYQVIKYAHFLTEPPRDSGPPLTFMTGDSEIPVIRELVNLEADVPTDTYACMFFVQASAAVAGETLLGKRHYSRNLYLLGNALTAKGALDQIQSDRGIDPYGKRTDVRNGVQKKLRGDLENEFYVVWKGLLNPILRPQTSLQGFRRINPQYNIEIVDEAVKKISWPKTFGLGG